MSLKGRRALVTGGGRGIGRAVALRLAGAGADVVVAARSTAEIGAVAAEAGGLSVRALAIAADVSRPGDVRKLFASAREALGGVDLLVPAAGIAPSGKIQKTSDEDWAAVIGVNLSGAFYCVREALPEMAARGFGRVVLVASIAGKTGIPYLGAYVASKHGVLGLAKAAALEVAEQGVTVNAVCPGYVDTPMTGRAVVQIAEKTGRPASEVRRRLEEVSPQKRMVTAEEVAALVEFLCRDEARGITGQALSVDGGSFT